MRTITLLFFNGSTTGILSMLTVVTLTVAVKGALTPGPTVNSNLSAFKDRPLPEMEKKLTISSNVAAEAVAVLPVVDKGGTVGSARSWSSLQEIRPTIAIKSRLVNMNRSTMFLLAHSALTSFMWEPASVERLDGQW